MRKGQHISPPGHKGTDWAVRGLTAKVVGFGFFLKQRGFRVYQSGIQDALRSLNNLNIHRKEEFFDALRANLVSSDLEWTQFPRLFTQYWQEVIEETEDGTQSQDNDASQETRRPEARRTNMVEIRKKGEPSREDGIEQGMIREIGYSPFSSLEKADVGQFEKEHIAAAQLVLKRIANSFRTAKTRRMRRAHQRRSVIDFPKVARRSLRYGGIPMELYYREKKRRLKRLVVIADVSGSMERYARFVIPFLLGLRGIGPRAEFFGFSTTLARVTHMVRHLEVEEALRKMMKELPEWSGGTRIGLSLHQFNQRHGASLLNQRAVVLILSDGWDLGAKELLRKEMAHISAKARCIIWLNPLAADPSFQPICRGMQTVMPYVDYLLPANSLESLRRVGRLLSKVMTN